MKSFRQYCQHLFNPLHVFCRLRQAGVRPGAAMNMCRVYERSVYRIFR